MLESIWWAFVLRTAQGAVEASPTLLCGVLTAGILRRMVGPAGTRRLFGTHHAAGLLQAWGLGMLLPVCSLGVLPVAHEMRRAGVSGGNILAFCLAAPLLNPISFLYGLTLAEPLTILCYTSGSLILSLVCGLVWERLFPRENHLDPVLLTAAESQPMPTPGVRRILAVAVTAARALAGIALVYFVVGLVASGLLSALLPFGGLQATMKSNDPFSPLLMAILVAPAYMGPLPGMMRIGLMFEHGNSVGAAFVLLVLGIAVNVGLLAWTFRTFAPKAALAWFGLVGLATLSIAYVLENPLKPHVEPADHTHAFDDFTNPFPSHMQVDPAFVWGKLTERLGVLESFSLVFLAALMAAGMAERLGRWRGALEAWLNLPPTDLPGKRSWDLVIPGPILGGIALLGLVVFSVFSVFVYYPPPDQLLQDMARVKADAIVAVRTGKTEEGIRRLEHWDLLTRKLQVGVFLRTGKLNGDATKQAEEFRESLEKVRDALLAANNDEARTLLPEVEKTYWACRQSFARLSGLE